MGSISNLSSSYLQSLIGNVAQGAGIAGANARSSAASLPPGLPPDSQQLSGLAQVIGKLRQLQATDPAQFKQVTQQIAVNLHDAAQTAQSNGNTTTANQLNQLSASFSDASKSGQLPDIQGLSQAKTTGHHHHGHSHAAAYQTDGTQPDPLNPTAIILDTLAKSSTGVTV
jgi:hypothetical protein